ncbi:MAG TPA: PQQ-binding-like beta-propeller repeat protein [Candidatus Baltobacteraceae bacterium]|nr:PQQ-binding-like beta-propeller repeat protein [Candidatus Baltobacteraceae bacterium]
MTGLLLAVLTLKPIWSYHATHWITSMPTVADGSVYVGTWGGTVLALDATSGRLRWRSALGANPDQFYGQTRGVVSSIAVTGRVAYAVSGSCLAGAFDTGTGRTLWKRRVCSIARNDDTYATPVVADGVVLIGIDVLGDRPTDRGSIVALDARTGTPRWRLFPERYRGSGTGISATPAVDPVRGIAYVGTGNPTPIGSPPAGPDPYSDSIISFDVHSGRVRWVFGPIHPHDTHDRDMFASPNRFTVGTGSRAREVIGEGGKDGIYYAVDAADGHLVWRTPVDPADPYASIIGSAACGSGLIFVPVYGGAHGALVALSQRTGRMRWRASLAGIYEAPALWKGIVFVIGVNGTLAAFDAADGRRLLTMHVTGRSYGRGPRAQGSRLYVTAGSRVTAYAIWR